MTITINGRTPEEIKRRLEHCSKLIARAGCSYDGDSICDKSMHTDSLALIQQLERERDEARNDLDALNYANIELHSAYEAMKRERDAAVGEIDHICDNCKFADCPFGVGPCPTMEENNFGNTCSNWQWRGVQEVN